MNAAKQHVSIIRPEFVPLLACGAKSIESRFYRRRIAPFGRIRPGDTIHFKLSGGRVLLSRRAARVAHYAALTPRRIARIQARFNGRIRAPREFWVAKRHARYAVLIWLEPCNVEPQRLAIPRQYGSGWIVI